MAQMYPSKLDKNHIRFLGRRGNAEFQFYHLLSDQLSDEWRVLWGRDLEAPKPIDGSTEGEADFIAVHEHFGIYVLEVKGGGLEYRQDEHVWVSWGRDGNAVELSKSPAAQVKRTRRLLQAILTADPECPKFLKSPEYMIGWAVVFNQCRVLGLTDADLPEELILDELDMDRLAFRLETRIHQHFLKQAVERALENDLKRKDRSQYRGKPRHQVDDDVRQRSFRISSEGWGYLCRKFLGSELLVRPPRLSTQIRQEAEQLHMLTYEQYHLIEHLEDEDHLRARIRGCSGSGKTLCAIELARRFAKQKKNVLLLCYNSALAAWLERETDKQRQFVRVDTIHGFCRNEMGSLLSAAESLPPERRTEILDLEWPITMAENLDRIKKRYDVIIVDEAQDYRGLWWEVIPKLLKADTSRFYVFYDENQILYHDSAIGQIPIAAPSFTLRRNCRNTKSIHELITRFYRGKDTPINEGPEGTLPKFFVYDDKHDQQDGVRRLLARWGEGLGDRTQPYDEVVILTLHGRTKTFLQAAPKLGNVNLVERPDRLSEVENHVRQPYTVLWSTDRRFKGLESDAVILIDIDQQEEDKFADNLIYVGGSRARHRLYGFIHRQSLEWIRQRIGESAEYYEDLSALKNLEL